ncbi:MAG: hypothetical protein IJ087_01175 [Eggerthellaceae bacterium]|nr:hypothetical protein [Eggerthellaceae bacterium]
MGFLKDFKKTYKKIDKMFGGSSSKPKSANKASANLQFEIVGEWELERYRNGSTSRYRKDGRNVLWSASVEEEFLDGTRLIIGDSADPDKEANWDKPQVIAYGTNDELFAWFKSDEGINRFLYDQSHMMLVFTDDDKLHTLTRDGQHKSKQIGEYSDFAGNALGFFWWSEGDDNKSVQIKGVVFGSDKPLNKRIKSPDEDYYFEDANVQDDGVHVKFYHYEDESIREFVLSTQSEVIEIPVETEN